MGGFDQMRRDNLVVVVVLCVCVFFNLSGIFLLIIIIFTF